MRPGAFMSLLLCVATTASAQSITSFAPDTTNRVAAPDKNTVDIPVWIGAQLSPLPWLSSKLEARELAEQSGSLPWIGVGATWPWAGPQQGWIDIGYQHWRFGESSAFPLSPGTFVLFQPFSLDRFTVRAGVDQVLGRDRPLSLALGVGIGFGTGFVQQAILDDAKLLANGELIAHALVFIRVGPKTRLGVGASGVVSLELAGGEFAGPWNHLELVFRLDQMLRLPKRIVPGL